MDAQAESFPMMLYQRFRSGESVEQLAVLFEISADRVARRLRAAALCQERRQTAAGLMALGTNLAEG